MSEALLERSSLIADMDGVLAATVTGGGRAVLIAGEAGIGKSALVRQFVRRHESKIRFLNGMCDPLLTPRALGPLRDMAGQVGGPLAGRLGAGVARDEVFAAFVEELVCCRRPQVVLLEDVHWADNATLDLLVFLGRRLDRLRVMLVVTYRDDELGTEHPLRAALSGLPADRTLRLRPMPLSEAAAAELARRAGRAANGLHAITGGNPLLVTEVLTAGEPGVPRSVHDLVLARCAALTLPARELVRFVAVIPTRAESWVLEAALEPDPALMEACVAGGLLVVAEDTVGFRHELIRLAVEEALSAPRRRELNRKVLDVLSSVPDREVDLARLVHHARQAGDTAAVLRYAPRAARAAEAVRSHREAAGHYRAALSCPDGLTRTQRAELLEGYSGSSYLMGRGDEALTARLAALEIWEATDRIEKVGESLRWLSRLYWWAARRNDAETAAARAIAVLEPAGPGRELAMAYSNQAQLDMLGGNPAAIEWGSRALTIAAGLDDQETMAHALTNIGTVRLLGGDPAGRAELQQAIELACRGNLHDHAARAMVNLAYVTLAFRDDPRAGPDLDRGIAFALDRDLTAYAQHLTGMRAWYRLDRGDWPGAERDAREVLDSGDRPGSPLSFVPALLTFGRLQARRGDAAAAATLGEAARLVLPTGEPLRTAPAAAARAEHAWLCGDPAGAAAEAAQGLASALRSGHPWFAGELAWWLWRAGRRPDVPSWVARPYRLLLTGDWSGAADAWERLGCPYEQAEALACADDNDTLLRALQLYDRLGATAAARLLRRRLRSRGGLRVPRGPRPATATNPANLTARQVQVLALLAARLSNAEIASRLSLSVRTVDHHVAAILAKLTVSSRHEAAAAAHRFGITPADSGPLGSRGHQG